MRLGLLFFSTLGACSTLHITVNVSAAINMLVSACTVSCLESSSVQYVLRLEHPETASVDDQSTLAIIEPRVGSQDWTLCFWQPCTLCTSTLRTTRPGGYASLRQACSRRHIRAWWRSLQPPDLDLAALQQSNNTDVSFICKTVLVGIFVRYIFHTRSKHCQEKKRPIHHALVPTSTPPTHRPITARA